MADAPTCPYCRRRPVAPEFTPFCSERCKMADLGRWLSEDYRIVGRSGDRSPEGDPSPSADDTEDELRSDRD